MEAQYSTKDVAKIIHKSRETVVRYIKQGLIKATEQERGFIVSESALKNYINENEYIPKINNES